MSQHEPRGARREASSAAEALVQQAGFIFAGTVQRLGAVTMAGIPTERAAVVRVDSPLSASALLQAQVGRDLTVELRAPEELAAGQQAVFFADGWVYGQSIALRQVGHWPISDNLTRLRQDVVEARQRLADGEIQRRLAGAKVVVAGTVAQTAEITRDEGAPEREHDPRWVEAVIAVDLVLRGTPEAKSVVVLFAGSRHIAWRDAPKLSVGQSGIWILREDTIAELDRAVLVLVDPRDSWPLERLWHIQALLGGIG